MVHSRYARAVNTALAALLIGLSGGVGKAGEKSETVRVAAIQFISRFGRPKENRRGLRALIRTAARGGAKIVVLPETAVSGYMSQDLGRTWQLKGKRVTPGLQGVSPEAVAETVPGPSTREFGHLAEQLGIYLTVPIVEVDPKQKKYYNTLVLLGPDGKILLHYRKLNPWPWAERGWASAGDRGQQSVDTPLGRLGLLICYDINFEPPKLNKHKVDHLLYSIAWVDEPGSRWFRRQLPEIARRTNVNIIGANWSVSQKSDWHGYGHSLIIRRTGEVVSRAKSDLGNEIIYADLPTRPE